MKRLSGFVVVFSLLFLVFFMGPPLLNMQFSPYPLMKVGDVLDLFTPLVLIPLYWSLYWFGGNRVVGLRGSLIFMVFAALWVAGQSMHLAGNSLGHLMEGMKSTDVYRLTIFYDEVLSHYLWHFGIFALSALLIYRQWRDPLVEGQTLPWTVILAGIIYGFAHFMIVIEGATAPVGVPFAVLTVLFILVWGRKNLRQQPLLVFFLTVYLLALVLFLCWGIYWGGLPEFSKVGIIH